MSLQDFNSLDVRQIQRDVQQVMTRLRIAHLHAVDQDQRLLEASTADTHVRLYSERSPRLQVDALGVFQQVLDVVDRRLGNLIFSKHKHASVGVWKCQRSSAGGHDYLLELVDRKLLG